MSDKHENFINGYDNITKPYHYNWHPSGIEAKEITDDLPRWIGDAITYIWRRNHKGLPLDDRRKAVERLSEWSADRYRDLRYLRTGGWINQFADEVSASESENPTDGTLKCAMDLLFYATVGADISRVIPIHNTLVKRLEDEIKELRRKGQ